MAKIYLETGEAFVLSNTNAQVFGKDGTETVVVNAAATGVVVDQNVERVDLSGNSSSYTYQQAGNQLKVFSGTTLVATVPLQEDANGTQLAFVNGLVDVKVTTSGMTLGGATVPATAAAAVTPTTIDSASISASAGTVAPPAADSVTPVLVGIIGGTASTSIALTFNEALRDVSPTDLAKLFTVVSTDPVTKLVSTYPVGLAIVAGTQVTLALSAPLGVDTKVTYTGTMITDLAGNPAAAIPATLANTDAIAPTWTLTSPGDGDVGVAANANLTLTFADANSVQLGTGNVKLVNTDDATDIRSFAVNDATQVTFDAAKKTLVINPTADLKAGATYHVQVDGSAVRDLAGNNNVPGADSADAGTAFNFTVTNNKADNIPVTLPAAGSTVNVPLVNADPGTAPEAAKNTGADTVVLATPPVAGSTVSISNFTVGAGTDADTLKLGGFTGLTDLISKIESIKITESDSAFANLFIGRAATDTTAKIEPKQFLDFEVTLKAPAGSPAGTVGAKIAFDDLIALDALAPAVKALLPEGVAADQFDNMPVSLPAPGNVTTDLVAGTITFNAGDSAIATLVGALAENLDF